MRLSSKSCVRDAHHTDGVGLNDSLGNRIAAIRARMGRLKQSDLAPILAAHTGVDVDDNRLSRIEAGKELKFYEAIAILRALRALDPDGRGYDWLIGSEPLPLKQEKPKSGRKPTRVGKGLVVKRPNRRDKTG